MTAYSQGQAVEVWSNSKQAWLAAEVIKYFATSVMHQGEKISAGTVQVTSVAGVKCIAQEDIPRLLRAPDHAEQPESVLSFRWQVCTNTGWQLYSPKDAALLNEAASKGYGRVRIQNHRNTYEVDMKDLIQVNINTGNSRLIRKLEHQASEAADSPTGSATGISPASASQAAETRSVASATGISPTSASQTVETNAAADCTHTTQLPGLMFVNVPSTVRPGERMSVTTPQGEERTVVVPDGVRSRYWLRLRQ